VGTVGTRNLPFGEGTWPQLTSISPDGLNLAVHDVLVLARAIEAYYNTPGRHDLLDAYAAACLRRVWRAEHFSWWMTSMLHRFPDDDGFEQRLQLAQLEYTTRSPAAPTSLTENYVGLPFDW
jgi:p-hydroxybenzoate 3-monooxygenase